jgi:predicted RNA binding protein YcfA (HicA-like mRNA interferase family)
VVKLPVLSPREVIAVLQALGFVEVRQRGSHKQFRHEDGRATTVPVHGSWDISPSLLRQIIKDVGITREEFLRHR